MTSQITPIKPVPSIADELAVKTKQSSSLWAIQQLGELIRNASEHGGFSGINQNHWAAIGIAVSRMAESVYDELSDEAEGLESGAGL